MCTAAVALLLRSHVYIYPTENASPRQLMRWAMLIAPVPTVLSTRTVTFCSFTSNLGDHLQQLTFDGYEKDSRISNLRLGLVIKRPATPKIGNEPTRPQTTTECRYPRPGKSWGEGKGELQILLIIQSQKQNNKSWTLFCNNSFWNCKGIGPVQGKPRCSEKLAFSLSSERVYSDNDRAKLRGCTGVIDSNQCPKL